LRTILYIDDDSDDHELFAFAVNAIAEFKIFVLTAKNADEAWHVLRENHATIDVIFLDLNLKKGKSGFDVLKEIKKNEKTESIPVVIFTTSINPLDRIKSMDLGASRYVVKPNSFNDLQSVISSHVKELGI
jgi:CheY-like chemotaxis protein